MKTDIQPVTFFKQRPSNVPTERVLTIDQVKHVAFSELKVMNMILTNACNLSCSYCFEQHRKDYGRFDLTSLKKGYDFLVNCNNLDNKRFQFFGGEPLAQKKLILDFIRTYDQELVRYEDSVKVGIVTNGLLLTPEFIDEFCNKSYTQLCISLDTHDAEVDMRDIDQKGIDYILEMVGLIPQKMKDEHKFAIRCTINQESVPRLEEYIDKLYALGVRHLVIHPLIMSKEQGMIVWEEETWRYHYDQLVHVINKYGDFRVEWAEGVGVKGQSNCMVGSDMITVDASGEFSGCYFFTNLKAELPQTLLGNIFTDEIYIDRYKAFQKQYTEFHSKHEECQTCNYRDFCYQCPAGNASLGGELFRPDGMCKRIVQLFIVLRKDINKKVMTDKIKRMTDAYNEEGDVVLRRSAIHLMNRYFTGKIADDQDLRARTNLPEYRKVLAYFANQIQVEEATAGKVCMAPNTDKLIEDLETSQDEMSALQFYDFICKRHNVPVPIFDSNGTMEEECYFMALIHLPLFDGSQYAVKYEPEHSRSRLFDL